MLWYKAWLETRMLFLICIYSVTALTWYPVYSDLHRPIRSALSLDYYYSVYHGGYEFLNALWLVAVVFLTMGGLLREQAVGAAPFTLALPFSRARLMGVRITAVLIQSMILIVVPSAAICIESRIIGKPYPLSQIWFHFVLLASGGLVFFAIALLIASLVDGEYTAPLVGFCVVPGCAIVLRDPPLQQYSPFHFMGGADYLDRPTALLIGPLPWLKVGAFVVMAAILLAASVKAIQTREF